MQGEEELLKTLGVIPGYKSTAECCALERGWAIHDAHLTCCLQTKAVRNREVFYGPFSKYRHLAVVFDDSGHF